MLIITILKRVACLTFLFIACSEAFLSQCSHKLTIRPKVDGKNLLLSHAERFVAPTMNNNAFPLKTMNENVLAKRGGWDALIKQIVDHLEISLRYRGSPRQRIDLLRSILFTHSDQQDRSYKQNIQTIITPNKGNGNINVAIATELIRGAYVPGYFDVAVIVSSDIALVPAIKHCQSLGKRIAVATVSSRPVVVDPSISNLADFSPLIISKSNENDNGLESSISFSSSTQIIVDKIIRILNLISKPHNPLTLRNLGRILKKCIEPTTKKNFLLLMEEEGYKLFSLLREQNEVFTVVNHLGENGVCLNVDTPSSRSIISSVLQQSYRQRQDDLIELRNILNSLGKESYLQTDDFTKVISAHTEAMNSGVEESVEYSENRVKENNVIFEEKDEKHYHNVASSNIDDNKDNDKTKVKEKLIIAIVEILKASHTRSALTTVIAQILKQRFMSESSSMYEELMDLGYENISIFIGKFPQLFQLNSQSIVSLLPSSLSSSVIITEETQRLYEDILRSDPNTTFSVNSEAPKYIFDSPLSINRGYLAAESVGSDNINKRNLTEQHSELPSMGTQLEKLPLVKLQSICRSCDIIPKGTKRKLVELLIQKGIDITTFI